MNTEKINLTEEARRMFRRAIELAESAEREGNLPIGAVLCIQGEIIAEGRNAIWAPEANQLCHAEMEALRNVPRELWHKSRQMHLYTTLEPCLLCTGALFLHRLGRVVFGSNDPFGGAGPVFKHLPPYFEDQLSKVEWIGPAWPEACDPLYERLLGYLAERDPDDR
jgi:tRNA(adenine34) deaminase